MSGLIMYNIKTKPQISKSKRVALCDVQLSGEGEKLGRTGISRVEQKVACRRFERDKLNLQSQGAGLNGEYPALAQRMR